MGEWKANVTIRIRPSSRDELLEFAVREQRSIGNVGAVVLEWGLKQLKTVGSTEQLLKFEIRSLIDGSKLPRDT
jgi:hypothetical protein